MLRALTLALLLALAACSAVQRDLAGVDRGDEPREVLLLAAQAVEELRAGPEGPRLAERLPNCRAVLVFPDLFKLGLVWAGGGGPGVLLARQADGAWGEPAFYTMSTVGYGAQAGLRRTRLLLLLMTENATRQALSGTLNLGLEAGLAVAGLDAIRAVGTDTATPDVIAVATHDGLFGGASLDGKTVSAHRSYNARYHGNALHPAEIVALPVRPDPALERLRATLAPP